ncbi:Proton-dependent oligopeptide transporter family [Corchorus olitorius]|uniref:Proton-dependent oligopeptide transporter family n=1 Tax=Corchorus olitorius TaxID=93759 RepID=A0A1R3HNT5_9ROSI|nr:Proton-dependent oligopeptide transporter family [Corchorus olitorius]
MRIYDELRIWFRFPERLVVFTFGLLFSKGLMFYVLQYLMTFLTDFWNLKLKQALAIVNLHDGLRNMLQIHVAFCIDACLGYRWTLILSSLLYSSISPLLTLLRALVAAVRKRRLNYQGNSELLHHDDGEEKLTLTNHLGWLNKAAVKSLADDNLMPDINRWRLCTVKEVEQTKLLLSIIPMSLTFIAYGMVKSLGNTLFILQIDYMKGGIPFVVFQLIQEVSKRAVNSIYKMVFEKRIERNKRRYSDGVKIGIGMLASVACCAVAYAVETKRLKVLSREYMSNDPDAIAPISAWWLILQFFFLGAMEGLAGDGIQDFFGHYSPDSRKYGPVFTSSVIGFGKVLNIGFIYILDYYSKSRFDASWIGDSINQSRLDSIYRAYVMVALLNCFFYAYVSTKYSYDNIIGRPEEEEEIPFLEVKQDETAGADQQNNQAQVNVQLIKISVRN